MTDPHPGAVDPFTLPPVDPDWSADWRCGGGGFVPRAEARGAADRFGFTRSDGHLRHRPCLASAGLRLERPSRPRSNWSPGGAAPPDPYGPRAGPRGSRSIAPAAPLIHARGRPLVTPDAPGTRARRAAQPPRTCALLRNPRLYFRLCRTLRTSSPDRGQQEEREARRPLTSRGLDRGLARRPSAPGSGGPAVIKRELPTASSPVDERMFEPTTAVVRNRGRSPCPDADGNGDRRGTRLQRLRQIPDGDCTTPLIAASCFEGDQPDDLISCYLPMVL